TQAADEQASTHAVPLYTPHANGRPPVGLLPDDGSDINHAWTLASSICGISPLGAGVLALWPQSPFHPWIPSGGGSRWIGSRLLEIMFYQNSAFQPVASPV